MMTDDQRILNMLRAIEDSIKHATHIMREREKNTVSAPQTTLASDEFDDLGTQLATLERKFTEKQSGLGTSYRLLSEKVLRLEDRIDDDDAIGMIDELRKNYESFVLMTVTNDGRMDERFDTHGDQIDHLGKWVTKERERSDKFAATCSRQIAELGERLVVNRDSTNLAHGNISGLSGDARKATEKVEGKVGTLRNMVDRLAERVLQLERTYPRNARQERAEADRRYKTLMLRIDALEEANENQQGESQ